MLRERRVTSLLEFAFESKQNRYATKTVWTMAMIVWI
jgi:hypothetical protein